MTHGPGHVLLEYLIDVADQYDRGMIDEFEASQKIDEAFSIGAARLIPTLHMALTEAATRIAKLEHD